MQKPIHHQVGLAGLQPGWQQARPGGLLPVLQAPCRRRCPPGAEDLSRVHPCSPSGGWFLQATFYGRPAKARPEQRSCRFPCLSGLISNCSCTFGVVTARQPLAASSRNRHSGAEPPRAGAADSPWNQALRWPLSSGQQAHGGVLLSGGGEPARQGGQSYQALGRRQAVVPRLA